MSKLSGGDLQKFLLLNNITFVTTEKISFPHTRYPYKMIDEDPSQQNFW